MSDTLYVNNLMFDEAYYLEQNPDVAAVVAAEAAAGNVYTGAQHYYTYGANEGRAPNPWFDADFYQTINEDLKDMDANILLYHFSAYGAGEDRAPNAEIGDGEARLDGNLYLEYVLANADLMEAFNVDEGAEALTPEQNKWAADHFFNYGINEDRKGGIADVVADEKGDSDLESALQDYQIALTDHAATVAEEQAIAAAAVKELKLDATADSDTKLFDIKEVTEQVEEKIEELEEAVRESTTIDVIAADAPINEKSIALANEILANLETVAQNQVDVLKAKDAATVNLQEKVAAYNSVAKQIDITQAEYETAGDVLAINNDGGSKTAKAEVKSTTNFDSAEDFQVTVDVTDAKNEVSGTVVLSFDKAGKLVVEGYDADAANALAAAQEALNNAENDLTIWETFDTATATDAAAAKALTTATDAVTSADGVNAKAVELTEAMGDASDASGENGWDSVEKADAAAAVDALIEKFKTESDAADGDYPNKAGAATQIEELTKLLALDGDTGEIAAPVAFKDDLTFTAANKVVKAATVFADTTLDVANEEKATADSLAQTAASELTTADAATDANSGNLKGDPAPENTAEAKASLTDAKAALAEAAAETDSDVVDVFNGLAGLDAFKEALEAVYGNIALEAAAASSIDAATLNALKVAGYKVYVGDNKTAVAWSKVKVKDGELVRADEKDGANYVLKALDSKGEALTYGKDKTPYSEVNLDAKLVSVPGINPEDGGIDNGPAAVGTDLPNYIADAATKSETAVNDLQTAKDNIADFNKAVEAYNKAVAAEADLEEAADNVETAADAVAEAEEAFGDLGYNLVKADSTGVATGKVDNEDDADLFVYGESKLTVENFDGQDVLYFGDKAQDIVELAAGFDVTKGNLGGSKDVLDIFVQQVGNDTILYVEKEAYAGNVNANVADNNDIVEIKLAGVNAADVYFEDGFLALA